MSNKTKIDTNKATTDKNTVESLENTESSVSLDNLAKLEEQYALKMQELEAKLKQVDSFLESSTANQSKIETNKNEEIHPNKKISVSSMTYGPLTVAHNFHGFLKFSNYGETKKMTYAKLSDYVLNSRETFRKGYLYIHDMEVVEDLGLADVYEKMLNDKIVKNIFLGDNSLDYVDILKNCTEQQKQNFANTMAQKICNNEFGDLNAVKKYSDAIGVDIAKVAKDMKGIIEKTENNDTE